MTTSPIFERLESRTLLSGGGGDDDLRVGDITRVEMNGRMVDARAGEWIVSLRPSDGAARDVRRGVEHPVDLWLAARMSSFPAQFAFDRYLGRDTVFLVRTPVEASHAEVASALASLPGFAAVEPNIVMNAFDPAPDAGDVSATAGDPVESPFIFIFAESNENHSNTLFLEPGPAGGLLVRGGEGTTINGSADPLVFSAAQLQERTQIRVGLHGGRDQLIVRNLEFPGHDLAIWGDSIIATDPSPESGRDSILIESSSLRNLTVTGGLDRDWIGVYDSALASFTGSGGGHRDTLEMRRTTIAGDLNWNDRSGPGGIFLEQNVVGGAASLASLDDSGAFPVWARILDNQFATAAMSTGDGDDHLEITGNTFSEADDIDLLTGGGDDDVLR